MSVANIIEGIKSMVADESDYSIEDVHNVFNGKAKEIANDQPEMDQDHIDMMTAGWLYGVLRANGVVQAALNNRPYKIETNAESFAATLVEERGFPPELAALFAKGFVGPMKEAQDKIKASSPKI